MDARACAFRKKDLEKVGMFDDSSASADADMRKKLEKIGKIKSIDTFVYHLHKYKDFKKLTQNLFKYAELGGMGIASNKLKEPFIIRKLVRFTPFLGFFGMMYRYPFKEWKYLIPYIFIALPIDHVITIAGFWKGFLKELTK